MALPDGLNMKLFTVCLRTFVVSLHGLLPREYLQKFLSIHFIAYNSKVYPQIKIYNFRQTVDACVYLKLLVRELCSHRQGGDCAWPLSHQVVGFYLFNFSARPNYD